MQPINTGTKVCAVIGNPVGHSLSPAIHNAAFAALDLNFVYVAFRVEHAGTALAGMRALENFRGMSITIPHKIEAISHVDDIADLDRAMGAINTVVNENGRLIGSNTDGPGALKALESAGVNTPGKTVLLLGAGGVARAIAFTLAWQAGIAELVLLDIDNALLERLSSDLKNGTSVTVTASICDDTVLKRAVAKADIVIHCTPVGMHPRTDASLVPAALLRQGQTVFDVVYNPLETRLLRDARAQGLKTVSGVELFIHQAVLQFEKFTGTAGPVDVMRRVVMEHLKA
ncbi:MAG: shikimate dehydrogenase [Thermodesulfobacteriota bacterium]